MLLLAETTRRLTSSVHKLYKETQAQERTHDLFNTIPLMMTPAFKSRLSLALKHWEPR